ncbi:MAG: hotdog family protein [Cellvibrionaceae bacterium]
MSQYAVEDVVPHARPMALLDTILEWSDTHLIAEVAILEDSPFTDSEGVPSWVGIEYMAQTIAAYAGVQAREHQEPVKIGFLVGSRRYNCNSSYFPIGSKLQVSINQEVQSESGLAVFQCCISGIDQNNKAIEASANLNVFQPNDPESFLSGESPL